MKILSKFLCCFQLPKEVEVLDCILDDEKIEEISSQEIGIVVNIEEDHFEHIVRQKVVKEIDFQETTSNEFHSLPEIHPAASGDFDLRKLTMVSILDENYKADFESDTEPTSNDDEVDTLDLINQTTSSMKPILSDTFNIERDFRNSLTVLDAPDLQVHDSRLSFDPIPIGCMRKLVAEGRNKSVKLLPTKEDESEEDIEELKDLQEDETDDEDYDESKFSAASSSSSLNDNLDMSLNLSEVIGLHTDELDELNKRIEQLESEIERLHTETV